MKPLMKVFQDETGQALPWMVLLSVLFLGAAGLALDLGHAYACYQSLQDSGDAAALAGARAMTLNGASIASASSTACSFSANTTASTNCPNGVNTNSNFPSATAVVTMSCVTDSSLVTIPCTSSTTGNNVIVVRQSASVPTFFIRALAALGVNSAKTVNLSTTSTATLVGSSTQVNVAIVIDATASMSQSGDCGKGATKLQCALEGAQTLLTQLQPCAAGSKSCSKAFDSAALFVFPMVNPALGKSDICGNGNGQTMPYDIPSKAATYQITNYLSDFQDSGKGNGSLTTGSELTSAVGTSNTNGCVQAAGEGNLKGEGTYYADAITAAQASFPSNGGQNIMIILGDGDAGSSPISFNASYKSAPTNDFCQYGITASQAAKNAGTTIYTIGYQSNSSVDVLPTRNAVLVDGPVPERKLRLTHAITCTTWLHREHRRSLHSIRMGHAAPAVHSRSSAISLEPSPSVSPKHG